MIQLTPAKRLPQGMTVTEYEDLSDEERDEVSLEGDTDILPVVPQNILRVLPYEGDKHPEGQSRVEYVTGSNDVVEESPGRVMQIANQRRNRLEHLIQQLQGVLRGI